VVLLLKLNAFVLLAAIAGVIALGLLFFNREAPCEITARNALQNITFSQLPQMPGDFCYKLRDMRNRKMTLSEFASLGEAYWRQPELQPNFESYAIKAMLNPPQGRWAANGYGAYPADAVAEIKPGETFEKTIFFKTSWLVESYQGIALDYGIESVGEAKPGFESEFEVKISPGEFLLGPAYPVFDRNWTEKVDVKVRIANAEPGEYLISFKPVKPSQSAAWGQAYPHYFDATGFGLEKPFFKIRLIVKE